MSYDSISKLNISVGQARSKLHKLATKLESLSPENFALIEVALKEFDERFEELLSSQKQTPSSAVAPVLNRHTEAATSFKKSIGLIIFDYCDDTFSCEGNILLDYAWDDLGIESEATYDSICRDILAKTQRQVPAVMKWERVNSWSMLMWMSELFCQWSGPSLTLDADTDSGQINLSFFQHYWLVVEDPKLFQPRSSNYTFGELNFNKDRYKALLQTCMIRLDITVKSTHRIRRYDPDRTIFGFCDAILRLRE